MGLVKDQKGVELGWWCNQKMGLKPKDRFLQKPKPCSSWGCMDLSGWWCKKRLIGPSVSPKLLISWTTWSICASLNWIWIAFNCGPHCPLPLTNGRRGPPRATAPETASGNGGHQHANQIPNQDHLYLLKPNLLSISSKVISNIINRVPEFKNPRGSNANYTSRLKNQHPNCWGFELPRAKLHNDNMESVIRRGRTYLRS